MAARNLDDARNNAEGFVWTVERSIEEGWLPRVGAIALAIEKVKTAIRGSDADAIDAAVREAEQVVHRYLPDMIRVHPQRPNCARVEAWSRGFLSEGIPASVGSGRIWRVLRDLDPREVEWRSGQSPNRQALLVVLKGVSRDQNNRSTTTGS